MSDFARSIGTLADRQAAIEKARFPFRRLHKQARHLPEASVLEQLKKLRPFHAVDEGTLTAVLPHVSRLTLPAGRSLLRRGQVPHRELFLLEGVVTVRIAATSLRLTAPATEGRSLNARLADGASEISTLTEATLLAADLAAVDAVLNAKASAPAVAGIDDWMQALLHGPIMRWFSPSAWARVLRTGELRRVRKGERLVAKGEICQHVFVVAEGVAKSVCERFPPGGFFGEESALGQQPAPHDIVMETDGAVVCFSRIDVIGLAADYDPPRLDPPPWRFDLDNLPVECEEERLAALAPGPPIAVRSSDPARRLRVAARLMRSGFTVV